MRFAGTCSPEWGSCSRSKLLADGAHLHNCCCDRRYGKRNSVLLADPSTSGRSVHCGTHFGACCRPDRGGGHHNGCIATTTAVGTLAGPGASSRRGSRRDVAIGFARSRRGRRHVTSAPSVRIHVARRKPTMAAETLTARASPDERATASLASEAPSALKAPIKKSRALARGVPRYSVYAAARYQSRYGARERGSYGFLSENGSYGDRDY
jgi:hypothetical protein